MRATETTELVRNLREEDWSVASELRGKDFLRKRGHHAYHGQVKEK